MKMIKCIKTKMVVEPQYCIRQCADRKKCWVHKKLLEAEQTDDLSNCTNQLENNEPYAKKEYGRRVA